MDKQFNLFSKLKENLNDYYNGGVYLVGKPSNRESFGDIEDKGHDGGYFYSQKLTLEAIDLACASKFKKGDRDTEGKIKTYLNIVNFHADVSINQVGVNVSNYILEPTNEDETWAVFFMDKKFKEYSDEHSYDDIIDELTDDYCRKGTCVVKKIKGSVERVPLRTLKNSIRAKSLEDAARNGGYVIIENEMSFYKMKRYPKWNTDGIDTKKIHNVFEQMSLIPRAILKQFKGLAVVDKDWNDMICCYQVLVPDMTSFGKEKKKDQASGKILFVEEIIDIPGEFPLEEAHYKKIDGRWLGEGEVEKQLQNQISRNITANLRRRSLMWAAKKIFQSPDDDVAKNLLMEVKDGEVLKVKQNGSVSQVNNQTQHLGDFAADESSVKENSQQISFSFEAASGEAFASGTPFRLGAILENAVSKYFKRKQDTFSNFLKRSFFNQLIPIFQKEMTDEHKLRYDVSDDQYEMALAGMVQVWKNKILKDEWSKGNYVSEEYVKLKIEEELRKKPYIYWNIPDSYYKGIHSKMRLNINEPIGADIETLTTIWDRLDQRGDPRAEKVLKAIFAKKGKNLDAIMGEVSSPNKTSGVTETPETTETLPNQEVNK